MTGLCNNICIIPSITHWQKVVQICKQRQQLSLLIAVLGSFTLPAVASVYGFNQIKHSPNCYAEGKNKNKNKKE